MLHRSPRRLSAGSQGPRDMKNFCISCGMILEEKPMISWKCSYCGFQTTRDELGRMLVWDMPWVEYQGKVVWDVVPEGCLFIAKSEDT